MSTDSNAWTDPGWMVCRARPPVRGWITSTRIDGGPGLASASVDPGAPVGGFSAWAVPPRAIHQATPPAEAIATMMRRARVGHRFGCAGRASRRAGLAESGARGILVDLQGVIDGGG